MNAPISKCPLQRSFRPSRILGRVAASLVVGATAAALLFVSGPSRAASGGSAAAAEDSEELNLFWMSPRITSCGSCESKTWDRGKHCYDCANGGCNCKLEWFVDPASGQEYDGYFYPGVPISG